MTVKAGLEEKVRTFQSLNPATGEAVGEYAVHDEAAVRATVGRARDAADWWAGLGWKGRAQRLHAWKAVLARRVNQLAEVVCQETGKPLGDAQLEILLTIEHLHWAAKNARKVLGPRRMSPGMLGLNMAATLEYQPFGVVGVIGPWNYPVFTPMGSVAYSLAAGNTCVLKPSEYTPGVGEWLVRTFGELVPEHPVLQLVTGEGETGAALIRSGVDKVAFTGSTATAKRVMAACAESLTPIVAECGGKDAMVVDSDADLGTAADAAVWGAMSNAGQTCVGVERVYVLEGVYDEFVRQVTESAAALRPGEDRRASYGPMTMPSQLDVVKNHVEDAQQRGARPIVGGPRAVRPPYVDPVVLVDVPDDTPAMTEETFGPTVAITKVADREEALAKANATSYGLGATVFSRSRGRAMDLARRLRSGMTSINSVISFAGVPALPFGGVGDSGFGRIHGADGLREFARTKSITRQRFPLPVTPTSFQRSQDDLNKLVKLVQLRHGRR